MRRLILAVVAIFASHSGWAAPAKYFVVAPEHLAADITVMSLEPSNTITAGVVELTLDQYETATIDADDLLTGLPIAGTGHFTVASTANAADLLVPSTFAGTAFAVPHIAGQHRYYLLNTDVATATVTVQLDGSPTNLQAAPGVAYEVDAGSNNGIAGRVTSTLPIVLVHVAYVSGTPRDAYPVPPLANELVGIRSQNIVVAAASDGTSVTVYTSDSATTNLSLNAGERATVAVGNNGTQGQGAAVRLVSSNPIAAVQYGDGDGDEMTGLWSPSHHAHRTGLPIAAQYAGIACLQPSVQVTLIQGATTPSTQTCNASGSYPGKAYFGSATNGPNLPAGSYIVSSQAIYVIYDAAATEDEVGSLGYFDSSGPATPTLSSVASPTTSNPQSVSGTATASATVRLYVNGRYQATTTASGGGAFTFNAELQDGNNVLYATTVSGSNESDLSNFVEVTYSNNISRTQSGTISSYVVWTPGIPAVPYTVTANLTIAAGAKLVLQPGTTVKFATGTVLTANGNLKISGDSESPVTLTCNVGSPAKGCWSGVLLKPVVGNHDISAAVIEWTLTGVNIDGAIATVRNSTIRNFTNNGVYVKNSTSATLISGNFINNINDTGDCIETYDSPPQIVGNEMVNCQKAINVYRNSSPTIDGNFLTSNDYGVFVDGTTSYAPLPVAHGNRIYANDIDNYYVSTYKTGFHTNKLDATANWWGAIEPHLIAGEIRDRTDSTTIPTVDYGYFLDAWNGNPVQGNYLIGYLTDTTTTLSAGTTYDILGTLIVPNGKSLVIGGGAIVRSYVPNAAIRIDGGLQIQGTAGNLALLKSGRPVPARGDWAGISIQAGSTSLIEYADIQWADTAITVYNVAATIRYNQIGNFSSSPGSGIYVSQGGASGTLIANNVINNGNDSGRCIWVQSSAPTIQGNTLTNCDRGIYLLYTSSPTINGGNIITGNDDGIYVDGATNYTPQPVVTGNQIHSNDNDDFLTTGFAVGAQNLKLTATGNWWGTTDPTLISANIYDLTDTPASTRHPTVDYTGFLDGPGGSPVPGNQLIGQFTAASTVLTGGATYEVLSALWVPVGKSLTIPAGTTLKFYTANSQLFVSGTLTIQGSAGNLAHLTSGKAVPTRGDWPGIYIQAGSTAQIEYADIQWATTAITVYNTAATIRYNQISNFAVTPGAGIYVSQSGASGTLIANNVIDNGSDWGRCIWVQSSAPTIQGNTLTNCDIGIYLLNTSNPAINGGNIIIGNDHGIYVDGNSNYTPQPVVTGNQIHSNDTEDFFTTNLAVGAQDLKLNATGNWWGSTDPAVISGNIYDLTDTPTSTRNPTVDYSGFLDGPDGNPVPGNQLIGPFTATSTVLTAGATYDVLSALWVPAGKSLTIPAGTTLRFYTTNGQLVVNGTLTIQGSAGNLAHLTSAKATPARGDWAGVSIQAGSTALIEYALIDWVYTAITVNGAAATIRYNELRNFSSTPGSGVYVLGSSSGTLVANNLIDNGNDSGNCIWVQSNSPTIQGNTLTNCDKGVHVLYTASPTINSGNIITGNDHGIYINGNNAHTPLPVVNGNQIHSNDTEDFYTSAYAVGAQNLKLNATGNWWGSTVPEIISSHIYDLTDNFISTRLPTVDYSGFLDGPNGAAVPGTQLIGSFPAGTTNLTGGAVYDVLGSITVQAGATLVIPAGTRMQFHVPGSYLSVKGTLQVQGASGNMAIFTTGQYPKARGDWQGIKIESPATGTTIDYAVIEYANRNIELLNANALIRDCTIRNHEEAGIYATGATSATEIRRNFIENYDRSRTGIWLIASSPIIDSNRIHRNDVGIRISGNSTPQITANIISDNDNGINLVGDGSNSATSNPRPVITGNDIFGNTNYQLQIYNYGSASPIVVNMTGNWWGTPTPQAGTEIKFTNGSPASTANFSNPAAAPLNGAAIAGLSLSFNVFSPNADSVQDTTTLTATLSQPVSWTTTLRNSANAAVRTYTGTGTGISVAWDGKDDGSAVQADGNYAFEVTVPGSPNPQIVGYRLTQIDNTFPTLAITAPASGATLVNSTNVNVIGSASDFNFTSYTLEYGAGATPTSWTSIASGTAAVVSAALGNWVTTAPDGSIALGGVYTLRLQSTDTAGNAGTYSQSVTLDNLSGSGITQSVQQILPLAGEQVSFNFTMSGPGTATVDIYPDLGGAAVRQISQEFATGGAKSLVWDGKDNSGAYVPDEAYRWVLTLTDATHTTVYDPPDPGGTGSVSGTVDAAFNANANEFFKMNFTLNSPAKARVNMEVSGCVTPAFNPMNWVPFVQGTYPLMWDGRDAVGNLVTAACSIWFELPDPLRPFSVIVKGTGTVIAGTRPSPNLEVGGEPNIVVHSYDQIGRFVYRLSLDSVVTVKLLPPGITSFTDPTAITLVNGVSQPAQSGGQPADYVVEWLGHDGIDTNNIQVSSEGTYTLGIQAVSTQTGRTTLYRGSLQLYQ